MDEVIESLLIVDDYYAFLNIPKNASIEEINSSYRRLSLIYHPDKHVNLEHKPKAEAIFNKTKRAYEVLSDPHKRAIYDTLGIKGLETEGWQIVHRTKTPLEIREEYEKLAREREEQRLQRCTNPHGTTTISFDATELLYPKCEYQNLCLALIEVTGVSLVHSIEAPITSNDTVTMMSNISTKNGRGSGEVSVSCRRLTSEKGWADLDFGIGNGPNLTFTACRTIAKTFFASGSCVVQFSRIGFRPSFVSTLGTQFGNNTVGYLVYRRGAESSMSTIINYESENSQANISLQLGVSHSVISASYSYRMLKGELRLMCSIKIGTLGYILEYGAAKRISQHSTLAGSIMFGSMTGVSLKIALTRGSQNFVVPIKICEEVLAAPIFYATILPIISWMTIKKFVIDPMNEEKQKREREKAREDNKAKIKEMKREAYWSIELMKETYRRIRDEEESKSQGLLIVRAMYGQLPDGFDQHILPDEESADLSFSNYLHVIDVTVPVQCLVKDSKLTIQESSKSNLPGFFDVNIGEEKHLTIQYSYGGRLYICTLRDDEAVSLP